MGEYLLISSEDELVSFYGEPTIQNYNDWMQVSSFLKYGNKIYVARAANTNGSIEEISGAQLTIGSEDAIVHVDDESVLKVGDLITFADEEGVFNSVYTVIGIDKTLNELILNKDIDVGSLQSNKVYKVVKTMNAVFEVTTGSPVSDYFKTAVAVGSYNEFENIKPSIAMSSDDTKVKFIAKNPGNWGNDIEIAIAVASDFGSDKYVFEGIALDGLYEYFPTGDEVAIVTRLKGNIQDVFTVSFNPKAKDNNNKSMYIEDVINQQSQLIFVKDNTANEVEIPSQIFSTAGTIQLVQGLDSPMGEDDLIAAYELFENREEVDIDIVIANEFDGSMSAKALADKRKDCIAFIGATYGDVVGKKATQATSNLVAWRKGDLNFNNMFCVACANYVYVYNRYLDKNVWVNIAGHIAGLRAQTSQNRNSWLDMLAA